VKGTLAPSLTPPYPPLRLAVAHHVQKKATRKHNAMRPRKSRPSDINRKPPSYPAQPDIPWYTKIDTLSSK
jgi:hypothetical protein